MACTELLTVENAKPEQAQRLSLSNCDVTVRFEGSGRTARVILQLKEPAANAWRSALGPDGGLYGALLGADLVVKSRAASIPAAPLLSSYSARGAARHAWLWVETSSALRIDPVDPAAGHGQCPNDDAGTPVLWLKTLEVPPGGLIAPSPFRTKRPGHYEPIAPSCLARWFLSDGAPAVVHPALGLAIATPDATDGTVFELRAKLSKGTTVAGLVRITDPALHPLAGRWTETQERPCGGAAPIGELVFNADGTFTLVRQPFESYYDYWGTYRYAPQSGALTMEVTGGNELPSARLAKGTARFTPSGDLLLEKLPPPDAGAPTCARRFRRE
jgi:hypothetical protein